MVHPLTDEGGGQVRLFPPEKYLRTQDSVFPCTFSPCCRLESSYNYDYMYIKLAEFTHCCGNKI